MHGQQKDQMRNNIIKSLKDVGFGVGIETEIKMYSF